jgi:acyl-CoA dehydrogenase
VRDLCARYPDEYFRRIGEHRGYLEEFANALTKADGMGLGSPTFEWMQCLRLATTAKQS